MLDLRNVAHVVYVLVSTPFLKGRHNLIIPGSPFALFWTSSEVEFRVFNGKSAGKENRYRNVFDIDNTTPFRFDPANTKKKSVIQTSS